MNPSTALHHVPRLNMKIRLKFLVNVHSTKLTLIMQLCAFQVVINNMYTTDIESSPGC